MGMTLDSSRLRALLGPGLVLVALSFGLPISAAQPSQTATGQIGVRYLLDEQGMVLISVHPQMGAGLAGLVPGDRIVSVDGESIIGSTKGVAKRVRGPVGTQLKLGVRGPLGADEREVVVTRSKRLSKIKPEPMDPTLVRFKASLRTGKGPAIGAEVMQALIDADFLGEEPAVAIGSTLTKAARRHPKTARGALSVLAKVAGQDASIHQRLGEAYQALGEPKLAVQYLSEAERLNGADVRGGGFSGGLDARYRAKQMLIKATWDTGNRVQARKLGAQLAQTRAIPEMLKELGVEDTTERSPVFVNLPPLPPMGTSLLDDTPWMLGDHRGRVVLMAFWASWCGPCKRELPEIDKLWSERKDLPFDVLAVSVDAPKDRAKAERAAKKWGLRFPVAHDPGLGARLGVQGLPAVRLIGPDGSDRYSAKGYSPESLKRLTHHIDQLIEEVKLGDHTGQGQEVGSVWTRGQASVSGFVGVPGVRSVAARPGGAVVGVRGSVPVSLGLVDGRLQGKIERDVTVQRRGLSGRVGWLLGPVAASPGGWWVWHQAGESSWFTTLSSPVQDMVVSGDQVWVAMEEGLAVLDKAGALLRQHPLNLRDISPDGQGGVWGVDGKNRVRIDPAGELSSTAAPDSWSVARDGRWGSARVIQLVSGRFGPQGEIRSVGVRQDGSVVGMDASGQPALSLSLAKPPVIAVQDVDGDSRDEVLVVIRGQGVATLKLELP
jgi:thiol-disulfide isomerase/thioredoxin